jgi:beta-lactamase regulating signal transducer with metallopeptidase domain
VASLFEIMLSNALAASCVALAMFGVFRGRCRPALAHALWILVLVKFLTPPLFRVPLGQLGAEVAARLDAAQAPALEIDEDAIAWDATVALDSTSAGTAPPAAASPTPPSRVAEVDWMSTAAWVSATGTAAILGLALVRARRLARLLRHARAAPAALRDEAEQLSRRLGLRRAPEILLVPGSVSPMLWAPFARPRILLPADLLAHLTEMETRSLLLHELAHVRRRDHWVRYLELLTCAAYWWNPVVWWACRALRTAEEECCDAWVVSVLHEKPRIYADALVKAVAFVSTAHALPAGATGIGQVQNLNRRLTMIMKATTPRSLSGTTRFLLLALAVAVLPLVAAFAQEDSKESRLRKETDRLIEENKGNFEKLRAIYEEMQQKRDSLIEAGDKEQAEDLELAAHRLGEKLEMIARQKRKGAAPEDAAEGGLLEALQRGIRALEAVDDHRSAEQLARLAEKLGKERGIKQRRDGGDKKMAREHEELEMAMSHLEREMAEARDAGDEKRLEQLKREAKAVRERWEETRRAVDKSGRLDIRMDGSMADGRPRGNGQPQADGRSGLENAVRERDARFDDLAEKVERLTQIVNDLAQRLEQTEAAKKPGARAKQQ